MKANDKSINEIFIVFSSGLASQFGKIYYACPLPLSIMICREYIVTNIKKNRESSKSFEVFFHKKRKKENVVEISTSGEIPSSAIKFL